MNSSFIAFVISLLPFELWKTACSDFCESSLNPLGDLVGVGMLCERKRRRRENVLDDFHSFLPHLRARIQGELYDGHECLTETLGLEMRTIERK